LHELNYDISSNIIINVEMGFKPVSTSSCKRENVILKFPIFTKIRIK